MEWRLTERQLKPCMGLAQQESIQSNPINIAQGGNISFYVAGEMLHDKPFA